MPDLKLSKDGEGFIKKFETLRLIGYLPTPKDKPTIGWGHTGLMPDGIHPVTIGAVITTNEAETLFQHDTKWASVAVNKANNERLAVSHPPLLQVQFDALISLVFNIGLINWNQSHVHECVSTGDETQIKKWWLAWNKQAGEILGGLVARREAEWQMWSNMGTVA